jgi:hypothetical protein
VCFDGVEKLGGSAVVEKENALPDAPERRRAELNRACSALCDAVRQILAHVVLPFADNPGLFSEVKHCFT